MKKKKKKKERLKPIIKRLGLGSAVGFSPFPRKSQRPHPRTLVFRSISSRLRAEKNKKKRNK